MFRMENEILFIRGAKRIRNILLRAFLLTYALLVFSVLLYLTCPGFINSLGVRLFAVNTGEMALIYLSSLAFMKISAIVFFLFPALAIHWEVKRRLKSQF